METKLKLSRVGRAPVCFPGDVTVALNGREVTVKGKLGELKMVHHPKVQVGLAEKQVLVSVDSDEIEIRALHGTTRALINNMILGVSEGFEKKLNLVGVGYRASLKGTQIQLEVGKSHDVFMDIPKGIAVEISKKQDEIVLKGFDKILLGQFAASIIKERPVEPYKGKGIRYAGQVVKLKAGKKAGKK